MLRDTVRDSSGLLSIAAGELPQAIERLQSDGKELRRRLKDAEVRLAGFEAEAFATLAQESGGLRPLIESVPDRDVNTLKLMAQTIAAKPGHVAVLLSQSLPLSIVVARVRRCPRRCVAIAEDADRALWRKRRRALGDGAGRRVERVGRAVVEAARELLSSARDS